MRFLGAIFMFLGLLAFALCVGAWLRGGAMLAALGLDASLIRQGGIVATFVALGAALTCFLNAAVLFGLAAIRDNTAHLGALYEMYKPGEFKQGTRGENKL